MLFILVLAVHLTLFRILFLEQPFWLLWQFRSYLTSRQSFMHISGITSLRFAVFSVVPQGSVLGPLMFRSLQHFKYSRWLFPDDVKIFSCYYINSVDDCTLILIAYKFGVLLTLWNGTFVRRDSSLLLGKPVVSNMYTDPMVLYYSGWHYQRLGGRNRLKITF